MIRGLVIREAEPVDENDVRQLLTAAFETAGEAVLVEELRSDGDCVLELVATHEGALVGSIFFSRLKVETSNGPFDAVALAPLAVVTGSRRTGIGQSLVENAHHVLQQAGEKLSLVLGDPAYYGRFGYKAARAAEFESKYQSPYLQALAWESAPATGRLVYPPAFERL